MHVIIKLETCLYHMLLRRKILTKSISASRITFEHYRAIHDAISEVTPMTRVIRVTYFGVIAYHYHNASVCVSELGNQ